MPSSQHNPGTHGARGPVKPYKFEQPPYSQNFPYVSFDDDGDGAGWWSGAQYSFASVAIAASLALYNPLLSSTVANQYQDEYPTPVVTFQPDEDYAAVQFQQPTAPVVSAFTDTDEIIPKLDEDCWQAPLQSISQPAPQSSTLYRFDGSEDLPIPPLVFVPDEDVWVTWAPQTAIPQKPIQPWSDDDATSLYGQPDEDYWQNRVFPVSFTEYQQLPIAGVDVEEIPAGNLHGLYEDDSWLQSPPFSVPALTYVSLPLYDPEELPANTLHGPYEDDSWLNGPFPTAYSEYQRLPIGDPEEIPAGFLRGQPDEDYWQNRVQPVPFTESVQLPLYDAEEIPASALHGQYEDDSWPLGTIPVPSPAAFTSGLYWFDSGEITSAIAFVSEDDRYSPPLQWTQPPPVPIFNAQGDEYLSGIVPAFEDDSWRLWGAIQPLSSPSPNIVYTPADDTIYPTPSPFTADEDYWDYWRSPILYSSPANFISPVSLDSADNAHYPILLEAVLLDASVAYDTVMVYGYGIENTMMSDGSVTSEADTLAGSDDSSTVMASAFINSGTAMISASVIPNTILASGSVVEQEE